MAEYKRAVLTDKGLSLLAKAQAQRIPIVITTCMTGSGIYDSEEDIMSRTALKEPKQSFAPTSIIVQNEKNVYVRFSITNNPPSGPVTTGYKVRELGIIATDPDDGDILYAIAVTEGTEGDYLPAYSGQMPTVIGANFMIEVSNADEVIIDTDISAYVTTEELDARAIFWDGENESVTVIDGQTITERTSRGRKVTQFLQDGSIKETYPDGRVLITTFDGNTINRVLQGDNV